MVKRKKYMLKQRNCKIFKGKKTKQISVLLQQHVSEKLGKREQKSVTVSGKNSS